MLILWAWHGNPASEEHEVMYIMRAILFANHKANGVVSNIGLLANTLDDTGSYMAG